MKKMQGSCLQRYRVIVADDHPLFRDALCKLVPRFIPGACIEEAESMADVLALAYRPPPPDILILDLLFSGVSAIHIVSELRQNLKSSLIIVISMVDDPLHVQGVMAAGANGFIGKSVSPEEIGTAMQAIVEGDIVVKYNTPALSIDSEQSALLERLTIRQRQILQLITEGCSNKEVARELGISPFTVRLHVSALLRNLGISSRTEAAVMGAKAGMKRARDA